MSQVIKFDQNKSLSKCSLYFPLLVYQAPKPKAARPAIPMTIEIAMNVVYTSGLIRRIEGIAMPNAPPMSHALKGWVRIVCSVRRFTATSNDLLGRDCQREILLVG